MSDLDQAALWATDALLDSLAVGGADAGDDLALELLAGLVADVSTGLGDADDLGGDDLDLIDLRDPQAPVGSAAAVVALRPSRSRSRLRRLAPHTVALSAAAVVVLGSGGVAAASASAGPTSVLFPLHRVLTGQPQLDGSQRQALEIRHKLDSATRALAEGKVERAQRDVRAAAARLSKVADRDGRHALVAQWTVVSHAVLAQVSVTSHLPLTTGHNSPVTGVPAPVPTHAHAGPAGPATAAPKPLVAHPSTGATPAAAGAAQTGPAASGPTTAPTSAAPATAAAPAAGDAPSPVPAVLAPAPAPPSVSAGGGGGGAVSSPAPPTASAPEPEPSAPEPSAPAPTPSAPAASAPAPSAGAPAPSAAPPVKPTDSPTDPTTVDPGGAPSANPSGSSALVSPAPVAPARSLPPRNRP